MQTLSSGLSQLAEQHAPARALREEGMGGCGGVRRGGIRKEEEEKDRR